MSVWIVKSFSGILMLSGSIVNWGYPIQYSADTLAIDPDPNGDVSERDQRVAEAILAIREVTSVMFSGEMATIDLQEGTTGIDSRVIAQKIITIFGDNGIYGG